LGLVKFLENVNNEPYEGLDYLLSTHTQLPPLRNKIHGRGTFVGFKVWFVICYDAYYLQWKLMVVVVEAIF
jgi:hypothetical protein